MQNSFRRLFFLSIALIMFSFSFAYHSPAEAGYRGYWGPGAFAAGVVTGAVIAGYPYGRYAPYPAYPPYHYDEPPVYPGPCHLERRRVFDEYGNYIGRHLVRVCD